MKICILTSSFHPVIGGAESYAAMLAKGLVERGHEVLVITDKPSMFNSEMVPELEHTHGFKVIRCTRYADLMMRSDKIRWEQMSFSLLEEIQTALKDFNPDILHANSLETSILASIASLSMDIPVVATMHEQEPECEALGVGKCSLVYKYLPLRAFICGSNFYLQRALKFGNADHAHLIYHGIDTTKFSPGKNNARSRFGFTETEPVIVCAARLKKRKGILELVEAMPKIIDFEPKIKLLIAGSISSGSEDYAQNLKKRIYDLGIDQSIVISDDITFDKMPEIYRTATVAVAPSLAEGLGLAVLEAMACGVPLVATNIPGIVEIFEGFDLPHKLARPGDPSALSDNVIKILSESTYATTMVVKGIQHVNDNFSQNVMIEKTIHLYKSLV